MSTRKLKKASHPPPSYRPPPSTRLDFIAHSPPSPEQSNFPYSFHNTFSSASRTSYRTEPRSSRSISQRARSSSLPSSPRPGTVLSVHSGSPLISHLGERQDRQRNFMVASAGMPARKLTKPRKQMAVATNQYASLSASPMMSSSSSTSALTQSPPRRRATINWNVTWSFRRKKNVSVEEPIAHLSTPTKRKKFTLGPEEPEFDIDMEDSSRSRPRSPSPPRRTVYDLDPAHDQLPLPPPSQPQTQALHDPLAQSHLRHPRPQPRSQPMSKSQPISHDTDPLNLGLSHAHRRNSAPVSRRWTLAMAMTNTDMDDESFVKQVEAMRRASVFAESESPPITGSDDGEDFWLGHNGEVSYASDYDEEYAASMEDASSFYHPAPSTSEFPLRVPSAYNFVSPPPDLYAPLPFSPPTAENEWSSALHALLITRDLLKTERNYLASLLILLDSSPCASMTVNASLYPSDLNLLDRQKKPQLPWPRHPPPPLMHSYLLSLISASHTLISRFESDPSVMGAAKAFTDSEEEVEKVFVGWCGVVGGWFIGPRDGVIKRRRLSKSKFSEGKVTPSPSSTRLVGPPSPTRPKSFKSDSGQINLSYSSLRLSAPPALLDPSFQHLPPSLPTSPWTSSSTVNGINQSPPRAPRVQPVRPLSIVVPGPLPSHSSSPKAGKTKGQEERRPTLPRILSARYKDVPLPPLPAEANVQTEGEDKNKEKLQKVTVSRSSSKVRLLNLVGVGKKRTDSEASLGNGDDRAKRSKSKLTRLASSSPSTSSDGKPGRSKSLLLFGSSRSRSRTASQEQKTAGADSDETSTGSDLKRSMSDYWRKSVRPAFSPSSVRHSNTPLPNSSPPPPVPALPRMDMNPTVDTEANGCSNGMHSTNTSSGHDTDEGFYSAEGCSAPAKLPSTPPPAWNFGAGTQSVSAAGGVVIDGQNNKRIYS
ncbi:hypothetical protein V5O48_014275, partial [Marasmius crinis-equi]